MARDLLVAADRYDLERLRLMCEKILSENLKASTVMSTLLLVRGRKSCRQLEQSCIEYIATHPDVLAAVMATEEYEELKETCSPLVLETVERVAMAMHGLDRNSSLLPEKSSSTFNASEEVHGWHDFKIPNFNAVQRSHGVGQRIHSSPFKVGGYDWTRPKGFPGVRASRCFKIEDPSGTWPLTVNYSSVTLFARGTATSWGCPKCVGIENAKSKYMASDGSLTIRCEVDVAKEPYTSRASTIGARFMVTVPPSQVSTQLEQLLASKNGSDVAFLVEESEIRAHKLVIAARAPALHEAVVATSNKEDDHATAAVVRVDDMKAAVFKAVLHFIYADELLPGDGTRLLAGDMLTAACRFGLTRMKAICENLSCESLSKDNVLATVKFARHHHFFFASAHEFATFDFVFEGQDMNKEAHNLVKLF
ncbi:BTB/POZ and MATH domain-containing protein 2-like [Triticum aestivum]|uniref:BTB/POZ and MATH domain-containing protein 2-like n=1 Tax=Triticum aestivum TaxID=4565 RepID=UPI001D01D1AA|nr:BTB/POZ and MATH domain-containing protein 2-like [Triticum aestivum]